MIQEWEDKYSNAPASLVRKHRYESNLDKVEIRIHIQTNDYLNN